MELFNTLSSKKRKEGSFRAKDNTTYRKRKIKREQFLFGRAVTVLDFESALRRHAGSSPGGTVCDVTQGLTASQVVAADILRPAVGNQPTASALHKMKLQTACY